MRSLRREPPSGSATAEASRFVLDSFALVAHFEAERDGRVVATLVTGDPGFRGVGSLVPILWLRRKGGNSSIVVHLRPSRASYPT